MVLGAKGYKVPPTVAGTQAKSREGLLQEFVDWCAAHITGDEKGQAQVFVDRLLKAVGQKGAHEAGGTFEKRIKQFFDEGKQTSFAEYGAGTVPVRLCPGDSLQCSLGLDPVQLTLGWKQHRGEE